jgi:hypothetical protein
MFAYLPAAPKKEFAKRLSRCPKSMLLSQVFKTDNLCELVISDSRDFIRIHDIDIHLLQVNAHTIATKTIANCRRWY